MVDEWAEYWVYTGAVLTVGWTAAVMVAQMAVHLAVRMVFRKVDLLVG